MARKPQSEAKKKQAARQREMYTPAQRLAYRPCPCDVVGRPAQKTMDDAADHAISGGFKIYPKNICPRCHLARPVNGACCS